MALYKYRDIVEKTHDTTLKQKALLLAQQGKILHLQFNKSVKETYGYYLLNNNVTIWNRHNPIKLKSLIEDLDEKYIRSKFDFLIIDGIANSVKYGVKF